MGNASSQKYRDTDPLKTASEIISMVLDAARAQECSVIKALTTASSSENVNY
jgi:hypothetical protein